VRPFSESQKQPPRGPGVYKHRDGCWVPRAPAACRWSCPTAPSQRLCLRLPSASSRGRGFAERLPSPSFAHQGERSTRNHVEDPGAMEGPQQHPSRDSRCAPPWSRFWPLAHSRIVAPRRPRPRPPRAPPAAATTRYGAWRAARAAAPACLPTRLHAPRAARRPCVTTITYSLAPAVLAAAVEPLRAPAGVSCEGECCVAARSAPRCDEPPTPLPRLPPALQWQNSYHSDNQWVRRSAAARKGGAVPGNARAGAGA